MIMINVKLLWEDNSNTTDQAKWECIENYINALLLKSVGTQLPDSGLSFEKQLEWMNYRDDLKSIRDDFENPDDVILPTPPEEE
jgi:hypothetical protein